MNAPRNAPTIDLEVVRSMAERQRGDANMIASLAEALTEALTENRALKEEIEKLKSTPAPAPAPMEG